MLPSHTRIFTLAQSLHLKISIPTLRRVIGNSRGGRRVSNAKIFKRKYETKLEFPEGWGLKPKIPSVRGVWIFSVTIHSHTTVLRSASFKLVPYLFSIFMFS